MNKPAVFNFVKATNRIAELEKETEQLKKQIEMLRGKSYWVEEEKGIWCHNCSSFLYYDENLKEMEEPFEYCPVCGSYMEYMQGKGSFVVWRR